MTATQQRLAGQGEKLIAAEERVREMERRAALDAERLEELERAPAAPDDRSDARAPRARSTSLGETEDAAPAEDRRLSTPFLKEMSMDAQKTISRMMGVTQLLKHKPGAKEQTQLVQQLTAHARRLDNTMRDLSTSTPS